MADAPLSGESAGDGHAILRYVLVRRRPGTRVPLPAPPALQAALIDAVQQISAARSSRLPAALELAWNSQIRSLLEPE
ncbi:MAG: hypothetical protein JOY71_03425 [Acetobacteraceae bacterium]|nr:hypothetical protein [Acetobacteraceae bacterium]MBV8521176.1 hypothetical protein [Acetobacteraceae bacterium]